MIRAAVDIECNQLPEVQSEIDRLLLEISGLEEEKKDDREEYEKVNGQVEGVDGLLGSVEVRMAGLKEEEKDVLV